MELEVVKQRKRAEGLKDRKQEDRQQHSNIERITGELAETKKNHIVIFNQVELHNLKVRIKGWEPQAMIQVIYCTCTCKGGGGQYFGVEESMENAHKMLQFEN